MDESMNSVHSISAMDISPLSSPKTDINPIPTDHLLLNAFQQQQELLSNMLFSASSMNDYHAINKNPLSDEHDSNSKSFCLYSTVLTENNDEFKSQNIPDESNQLRQRMTTEPVVSIVDSSSTTKKSPSKSSGRSFSRTFLLIIPILFLIAYISTRHSHPSMILPRATNWQNASEYLTKNLIGQDQGLQEFKEIMEKHKNCSVVLIKGPTGTGKSYLASSLEKFLSTSLISANTLLGLSAHHWTESDRLLSYLSSHLSSSLFQILILDDLDLLSHNEQYCQTLTTALHSLSNNKNIFILLLHTGQIPNLCQENFGNIITKSIQFNLLQRHHIRTCIENEVHTQNAQPPLTNQQLETILNSVEYIDQQGVLHSTTGCKKIPSLVMLASKRSHTNQ